MLLSTIVPCKWRADYDETGLKVLLILQKSQNLKMELDTSIILAICALLVLHCQLALGLGVNFGRGLQDPLRKDFTDTRGTQPAAGCSGTDQWIIGRCAETIEAMSLSGFPWIPQLQTREGNYDKLKDPMDPINRICGVYDQFLNCMKQHSVKHVCLLTASEYLQLYTDFKFICEQPRSTALLHILSCLQKNRVLDLLLYHLADRYGAHFMEQYVNGNKNAFFLFSNSSVLVNQYFVDPRDLDVFCGNRFICFPQRVISHDIPVVIAEKCGLDAANFVTKYFMRLRHSFSALLNKTGLSANVCDVDSIDDGRNVIVSDTARKISGVNYQDRSSMTKESMILEFDNFLEDNSYGTALDTFYGREILVTVKNISTGLFCRAGLKLKYPVMACVYLAHDRQVPALFNILQFAHSLEHPFMDYPHRTSMELLNSCWSLLEQICGRNMSYYDYVYTLISGTWEVQTIMDNLTCKWQDTLIKRYIEVSEDGNLWPTPFNFPQRPLSLSTGQHTFRDYVSSMSELDCGLRGAIEAVSERCNSTGGDSIDRLLQRIRFYWYDYLQLAAMSVPP